MNIKIENLSKYYSQHLVFENLNMIIQEGSIYGLKGNNGSGKTTLFRIMAGLEKQFSGSILYNNIRFNRLIQKNITYMHQKPYILRKSVFKNIIFPLKIRKKIAKGDLKKVDELMRTLDLFKFKDKKAWLLSGGEMQKVSLARALIFEPEMLLMDEPTAHMDQQTVEIIEKMIIERHMNKKMTTVIITHDTKRLDHVFDKVYHI